MIGVLFSFINFLKLEKTQSKKEENQNTLPKTKSEIIELDEKENFYRQKSEIVTFYVNGKEVKEEIIEEQIPLSKNTAKRQITIQRIR